jgi:beta-lactamase class A
MDDSRRRFVSALSAMGTLAGISAADVDARQPDPRGPVERQILELLASLPGQHALYMHSPGFGRDFVVEHNPDSALFCGSAFKAFVLAEFLRMVDNGEAALDELLPVDSSIWSLSSEVLTPWPGAVTGRIDAQTALDAMISRSDNTATDMLLKRVGPARVRQFIASIGLTGRIPDSTRSFFGYIFGAPDWQTLTWERVLEIDASKPENTNPVLNDVTTMAVSPRDFVSFYSRALQGEFFTHPQLVPALRGVLALSNAIPRAMPLGINPFIKGGSIDFDGEHALCLAGGVFIPPARWVYFGLTLNWTDAEAGTVKEVGPQFGAVVTQMFTLLRDRLGNG